MNFIGHILLTEALSQSFPAMVGGLFDYVFTESGIYVHSKRPGLEVCFPIVSREILGLATMEEAFAFDFPKVPETLVRRIRNDSAYFAGEGLETLFHLIYSPFNQCDSGWELVIPKQMRSATRCRPLEDGPGSSYDRAIIEIHSHGPEEALFSGFDNEDEQGFRIFGVVGRMNAEPEIRLRVGLFGFFREIPARWVMESSAGLKCCVESEMKREINL